MYCGRCGASVVEGGQFCASCGGKVGLPTQTTETAQRDVTSFNELEPKPSPPKLELEKILTVERTLFNSPLFEKLWNVFLCIVGTLVLILMVFALYFILLG